MKTLRFLANHIVAVIVVILFIVVVVFYIKRSNDRELLDKEGVKVEGVLLNAEELKHGYSVSYKYRVNQKNYYSNSKTYIFPEAFLGHHQGLPCIVEYAKSNPEVSRFVRVLR